MNRIQITECIESMEEELRDLRQQLNYHVEYDPRKVYFLQIGLDQDWYYLKRILFHLGVEGPWVWKSFYNRSYWSSSLSFEDALRKYDTVRVFNSMSEAVKELNL